jgi:hypothetical protein
MDSEYVDHYGFERALLRGKFGTNWMRFSLIELASGDYEVAWRCDPADETVRITYDGTRIYIQDRYYHTSLSPFDQKMKFRMTVPRQNYIQIVVTSKHRYLPREAYPDTEDDDNTN